MRRGKAGPGEVWHGVAGMARRGWARLGAARQAWFGKARQGLSRRGKAGWRPTWSREGGFRWRWLARLTNGRLAMGRWTQAELDDIKKRAWDEYGWVWDPEHPDYQGDE